MQLSSMHSLFPSYYCIHFVIHSMALFIANAPVKWWMQNILDACFICSLQFVRKLKVKGEQHIMRSVPFHSIIQFFLLGIRIMHSRSVMFTFLIKNLPICICKLMNHLHVAFLPFKIRSTF